MPEYTKHDDGTATCRDCGTTVFTKRTEAQTKDGDWIGTHSCATSDEDSSDDEDWESYYERLADGCPYC